MTREIYDLSALELSNAYRAKELSPVEATRAVLARIENCEPRLNVMYIINAEAALANAAASEKRWHESKPFDHIVFTAPFNMSEQPAASICAGYDEGGLPIGLQIVGHRFDDAGVMMLAHSYEGLRSPMRPWPDPI